MDIWSGCTPLLDRWESSGWTNRSVASASPQDRLVPDLNETVLGLLPVGVRDGRMPLGPPWLKSMPRLATPTRHSQGLGRSLTGVVVGASMSERHLLQGGAFCSEHSGGTLSSNRDDSTFHFSAGD
jgi:hypothetical protein